MSSNIKISAAALRDYRKSPEGALYEHTYEVLNGGRPACPVLFVSAGLQDGTGRKFTSTDDNVAWVPSALPQPVEAKWDLWQDYAVDGVTGLSALGVGQCYFSSFCDKVHCTGVRCDISKDVNKVADDMVDLGFARSVPPHYHGFRMHPNDEAQEQSLPTPREYVRRFAYRGNKSQSITMQADTLFANGFSFINGFYVPPGAVLELDVVDLPPAATPCSKEVTTGGNLHRCRICHFIDDDGVHVRSGTLSHGKHNNVRYDLVDWERHPDGVNRRTVQVRGGHTGIMISSTADPHWAAAAQQPHGTQLGLLVSFEFAKALTYTRTNAIIWNEVVPVARFDRDGGQPAVTLVKRYRFRFDPVATEGYLNTTEWLMRQACMINLSASAGDTKAASPNQPITVGGRELINWKPQSSFCDAVVTDYCQLHLNEEPCACFGERAKAQRDIAALGVGLPPQCFGGCAQVDRAYQLRQWVDTSCKENVCAAVIKEHGRSIMASGRQEVVCANRKYTLSTTGDGDGDVSAVLASLPPDVDEDEARQTKGTSTTSIVAYVLGALFALLIVFFIVLWLRARRGVKGY